MTSFASVRFLSANNLFRNIVSFLLLLGYVLNVVSFESVHQAVHHHDHSELHSVEAELDSCHRAIYHGDKSSDCDHKSHISETESDCELCKVLTCKSSEFTLSAVSETGFFSVSIHDFHFGSDFVLEPLLFHSFLRGPPNA